MRKAFALLLFLLACSISLWAQANANKGEITGTVYDANQAVVPNASVVIRNVATGLERSLQTNEAGQYRAVSLDPGTYSITATSSGFAPAKVENAVLSVGASLGVNITLQIQSTTTTIEVGETLINVALPAPATTIDNRSIESLPINGRRFQDFAVLTPTVQIDPQRQQLTFAGQRGIYSNIMLDGADYNQPFFGGIRGGERSNLIITVPQAAVQEFQVVTTGYSAEYGRSTGGILNTITRSGGNDYHGQAFYLLRHKELGKKDPVQNIASLETLQQFGGGIGGPIKKDKLFFFGAFEAQRSKTPRRVFFAQLVGRTPTAATQEAFNYLKGLEAPFGQTNNASGLTAKTDYQTAKGHRLTWRYNFSDASGENAVSAGTALDPFTNRALSNDGIEKDRIHNGAFQFTQVLSPTIINDIRFNGSYEVRPRLANSATPQVQITPIGYFGARNFLPTTQDDKRFQLAEALSITRSKHTFKLGYDLNFLKAAQVFGFNQFGGFVVASSNVDTILDILGTGGSIANRFDDRAVTYDRQIGNLQASMSMQQLAAFAQDSWRVTNNLTLDFGFRWEGQKNPSIERSNTSVLSRLDGYRFPNGAVVSGLIPDRMAQFMPRFGFAWSPFGSSGKRTVVRGHTGIFYASTPLIVFADATNNLRLPPGNVSIRLSPTATQTVFQQLQAVGVNLNQSSLDNLPVLPIETVQRASALALGGSGVDPFAGAAISTVASDFRNPRSYQAGLGVEREVAHNLVAGIQFNYVNTVNLLRNRDYNLPIPTVRAGDERPFYGLRSGRTRPITSLSSVTLRESSARSMYRGLTFSAQYRAKRLNFGAFYTWSELFDDDTSERDSGGFGYDNSFNLKKEYAYSRNDMRHQLASYATVNLPLGFELGMIFRARSGVPINPVTGADTNEDLNTNNADRPYTAPGVVMERNSFRNRKVINDDLRVMKNFRIGSSDIRKLQFSVEFFNLFNLDNVVYSGANGSQISGGIYGLGIDAQGRSVPVDPRFMRLRLPDGTYDRNNAQAGSPLQVQLGLRFYF
ncbi:MAG: TonB-dependent receptor [Bryobacterales bacterium]|nr:TonB-dependent receptor [Bryobacterales bacterium]